MIMEAAFATAVLTFIAWVGYRVGFSSGQYHEINRRNAEYKRPDDPARWTP